MQKRVGKEGRKNGNPPVTAEDRDEQPKSRHPVVVEALLGLVAEVMENAAPYILLVRRQRVGDLFQAHWHLPHWPK